MRAERKGHLHEKDGTRRRVCRADPHAKNHTPEAMISTNGGARYRFAQRVR
jgi:hypothetical protein